MDWAARMERACLAVVARRGCYPAGPVLALEFRCELGEKLPAVWADKDRVLQVFENLISNGLKFTRQGSITIGAKPGEGEVQFWVADTGAGIPLKDVPHVFEPFSPDAQRSSRLAHASETAGR
jgi:signal transduction histidine kinase